MIPLNSQIVIVAESTERVSEAQVRMARVGLEKVMGYLYSGVGAWAKAGFEVAAVPQISVGELKELIETRADLQVVDVRRQAEFQSGHAPRAITAPLAKLREILPSLKLDPSKPAAIICAGGYRSSAATSILQQHGFTDLLNVTGGTTAWIKAGYGVEVPAAVNAP